MIGITHQVSIAPPVNMTSTIFIAASIEIIEIRDIPMATLKASLRIICLESINVSSIIEVINPFIIARLIIRRTENPHGLPVN